MFIKKYYGTAFNVIPVDNAGKKSKKCWIVDTEKTSFVLQIVVTKKSFKRANLRNLARRKIIGLLQENKKISIKRVAYPQDKTIKLRVYPNKSMLQMDTKALREEMRGFVTTL